MFLIATFNEEKLLIALNRGTATGDIFLVDYSNASDVVLIDFDLDDFNANGSSIRISIKNGFISNDYFPCFIGGLGLEVINWTIASNPKFGVSLVLPNKDKIGIYPKPILYEKNKILIYDILSGIIDISDLSNIHYITECNTDSSLSCLFSPQIIRNNIFSLEREYIHQEGIFYYLKVRTINTIENKRNYWFRKKSSILYF